MNTRRNPSSALRLLSACASLVVVGAATYMFVAGIDFYAGAAFAVALLGLGGTSVTTAESWVDILTGIVSAFCEGIVDVISGVSSAIGSLFSS